MDRLPVMPRFDETGRLIPSTVDDVAAAMRGDVAGELREAREIIAALVQEVIELRAALAEREQR